MYLYSVFYTNIYLHYLRMTHKKGSKRVGSSTLANDQLDA